MNDKENQSAFILTNCVSLLYSLNDIVKSLYIYAYIYYMQYFTTIVILLFPNL